MIATQLRDTPGPGSPVGAEVDAIAALVRGCAGVSALDGGRFGEVVSYLPGRTVPGVAVDDNRIRVQVRSQWGIRAADLAAEITVALAPLAGTRPVDVAIADIDDPPGGQRTARTAEDLEPWSDPMPPGDLRTTVPPTGQLGSER
jgi:hypothetical protein